MLYVLKSTVAPSITLSIFVILAKSQRKLTSRASNSTSRSVNSTSCSANSEMIAGVVTAALLFLIVAAFLIFFFKIYKSKYILHKFNLSCINNLGFVGCQYKNHEATLFKQSINYFPLIAYALPQILFIQAFPRFRWVGFTCLFI